MGQAKRRGTFEQRKSQAIDRRAVEREAEAQELRKLEQQISDAPPTPRARSRFGMLAPMLALAALASPRK